MLQNTRGLVVVYIILVIVVVVVVVSATSAVKNRHPPCDLIAGG